MFESLGLEQYLVEQLNAKWSEDMPVLYEMAIFIQDEFLEQYYEENGYPEEDIKFEFNDVQTFRKHLDLSQVAFRRQFDEE